MKTGELSDRALEKSLEPRLERIKCELELPQRDVSFKTSFIDRFEGFKIASGRATLVFFEASCGL